MATSPLFGWEEPDDVDLVKDGAAAIRTLGNAIDTSMGDLLGGTTGQVLSKNSNTNMDFTWVTSDDANAIQNAIVDAKGDLITATAADTPARLAVGANNLFLQAASGESTGLKWGGTWAAWTPVVTQVGTVTQSGNSSRFMRVGNTIIGQVGLSLSGTGTAGNRINITSVPATPQSATTFLAIGSGWFYDASTANCYPLLAAFTDSSTMTIQPTNTFYGNGLQYLGVSQFTGGLASGDQIWFTFTYEAV
jgi:hypothetical protein